MCFNVNPLLLSSKNINCFDRFLFIFLLFIFINERAALAKKSHFLRSLPVPFGRWNPQITVACRKKRDEISFVATRNVT